MQLFLRLYADCGSKDEALSISRRIGEAISFLSPEAFAVPKQYWKIETQYEFTFTLSPATNDSFQRLVALCPSGWWLSESGVERTGVWKRSENNFFLAPEVSWADAELHATAL